MSSIIDPITGLPYDALDTTLYSIPLNSQPALAPEWNPQGRITSTVYPDTLPTVFATMQAQNETNESTVQACSTDGEGNLNVNVKAGGGGATAGPYAPDSADAGFNTATSHFSPMDVRLTNLSILTLYRIMITIAWDATIAGAGEPAYADLWLSSRPNGGNIFLGALWAIARPGFAAGNVVDTQKLEIIYPGGWTNPWFIDPTDTELRANANTVDFINGISFAAEWKAR